MINGLPYAHQAYNGNKMFLNNDEMTLKPLTLKDGFTGDVYYTVIGNELHFVGSIDTLGFGNADLFDIPSEFKNLKFKYTAPAVNYTPVANALEVEFGTGQSSNMEIPWGARFKIDGQTLKKFTDNISYVYSKAFPLEILAMTFTR